MKDNQGALLITFIIFLTLAGILASSMAYLLLNVPYAAKTINSVEQSYYLSESGLRFALMKINEGEKYNELKDTYEYENREILIPKKAALNPQGSSLAGTVSLKFSTGDNQKRGDMFIHSVALVDNKPFGDQAPEEHDPNDAKRQVNAKYTHDNEMDNKFDLEDFDQEQPSNARRWNITESFVAELNEIEKLQSVQFKSTLSRNWVLASLNWGKYDGPPDLRLYQNMITKVLSYKIQINVNCYPGIGSYSQKGKDFMAGLNFRVLNSRFSIRRERIAYYGVSLFKSAGRQQEDPPCWLVSDSDNCKLYLGDSFVFDKEGESCQYEDCLIPNTPYIIFWIKKENRNDIELLAYCNLRELENADLYTKKLDNDEWGFKGWLNIAVFLEEKELAGQKINEIQVGLGTTSGRSDEDVWIFPNKLRFETMEHRSTVTLTDRSLVSKDLSNYYQTPPPDEMGFHAMYDDRITSSISKYNIYFRHFMLSCHGENCQGTGERLVQF